MHIYYNHINIFVFTPPLVLLQKISFKYQSDILIAYPSGAPEFTPGF